MIDLLILGEGGGGWGLGRGGEVGGGCYAGVETGGMRARSSVSEMRGCNDYCKFDE